MSRCVISRGGRSSSEITSSRCTARKKRRPRAWSYAQANAPYDSALLLAIHVGDGAVEHFVLPGPQSGDRRLDRDVGLDPDALQLPPVGVAHVVAAEADDEAARQHEIRHVAVRARRRRADERRSRGLLE